jgi:RNA polymerase sigma-70 factor (ECF subfamily)
MGLPVAHDVTALLRAWSKGDRSALDELIPLVYGELHRLAHHYMRCEGGPRLLQTTALVNEAYLRLIDASRVNWQNRAHFFAVSAQLMRRILVDYARSRQRHKRGSGVAPRFLEEALTVSREASTDLVALDEALDALAAVSPRQSQTVELRFFGGLTVEETAEVLKVSPETVQRDWKVSKAWLLRAMDPRIHPNSG